MKSLIIGICFLLAFVSPTILPAQPASLLGNWGAPDLENSTIKVYEAEDGLIYGKIIASDEADWIDKVILKQVKYDATSESWKGEVYSLRMYFSVDVELSLLSEERLKLVGRRFLMKKTFYWTREFP
ncbi:MAG: hypothetical protein AAF399_19840 [Bacteroidota bacterium]